MNIKDLSSIYLTEKYASDETIFQFYLNGMIPIWALPSRLILHNPIINLARERFPIIDTLYKAAELITPY